MKKLLLSLIMLFSGISTVKSQVWTELGGTTPGVALNANGGILSITSDASGNIYAGGGFTDVNGIYYVAKWDGVSWTEVGGTASGIVLSSLGPINSICSDAMGNIYAGGNNYTGNYNYYVAKWDGANWTKLVGTSPGITLNSYILSIY
jgi:hypothetical protein